jgi:hypothetical protein
MGKLERKSEPTNATDTRIDFFIFLILKVYSKIKPQVIASKFQHHPSLSK